MKVLKVIEFLFPALAALIINEKLCKEQTNRQKEAEKQRSNWDAKIKGSHASAFGKMADDLYSFEMQRLNILARKATSILAAAGFVISLTSITLVLKKDWIVNNNICSFIGLFLIVLAVIYFVMSALSATQALKISHFYQLTLSDVDKITTTNSDEQIYSNKWTIEKMVDVNLNYNILQGKINWLDSAQGCFLRGIFLIAISYIFLIFA